MQTHTLTEPQTSDQSERNTLRIAIQKSGRLSDKSKELLNACGIRLSNGGELKAAATNFPLEVLYLRDDDIPQYVADGVADIGMVGENVVLEKGKNVRLVERLGFGKCRLSLAVQRGETYTDTSWFEGRRIATSYPEILNTFLLDKGVNAHIEEISGSVEIAPGIGLAEGVCDIVSTGSTLMKNGLIEVEEVMRSEAVLISGRQLSKEGQCLLDKILFRMKAVQQARRNKYILLNAPDEAIPGICQLLPGVNSPTLLPLAREGWSSLHSVVGEDDFWEVIDQLKEAGAEGILVCPIEKMIG